MLASSRLYDRDMVRIYSINVTNTIDGGAASCLPCPKVSLGGRLLNPRQMVSGPGDAAVYWVCDFEVDWPMLQPAVGFGTMVGYPQFRR